VNLALRHLPEHFAKSLDEFFEPTGIPCVRPPAPIPKLSPSTPALCSAPDPRA
jgi:hypothetical protein